MSDPTWCDKSLWPQISVASGGISFLTSFVAQIPQLIETYRDKSVEGLSPGFLLCWLFGDITSLIGAVLTHQLPFQILLAVYYLSNDMLICGQYYYYGILHRNQLATPGHESATLEERTRLVRSRGSNPSIQLQRGFKWWILSFLVSQPGTVQGFPMPVVSIAQAITGSETVFPFSKHHPSPVVPIEPPHTSFIGQLASWVGAMSYFCARIPQLIKNYKRKSTDGLSPLLFISTLIANVTYTLSIFTSCSYLTDEDKLGFVLNALPFIVGSAGTVVFDLIYFYQHYVLYAEDYNIRRLESDEFTPLMNDGTVSPLSTNSY